MVVVFLMMATLCRNLKKVSLSTNGLTSKDLVTRKKQKNYWKY